MTSAANELRDFDRLWDYNQPAETERRFRALLLVAEAGDDRTAHAELLTQIARSEGLQRKFADALGTLDAAQDLLPDPPGRASIRLALERGRVWNSSGSPDQARPFFLEAWELATALGDDALAIDALHMLAIVSSGEEQLAWNLKALALAERSSDPAAQRWIGSLCNNLGWTYHDGGQYADALALFERALSWRIDQGNEQDTRVARWCVARTLRSLGRTDDALIMQLSLLTELDHAGESDGYVHEELAECLLALDRADEARPQFSLAYAALAQDAWLVEHEPARLERLRQLGQE